MLLDRQMRDGQYKEAMRTSFRIIPNDDVFTALLDRLEAVEQSQR